MSAITVYVLEGAARRYVGITADLPRRLREHRTGSRAGKLIGEFRLLHTESFPDYAAARVREKFLKSGKGRAWLAEKHPRSGWEEPSA
jgi:putative endonuclease